jgi:arylamine N-acetyltransferase
MLGRIVATLAEGVFPSGTHRVEYVPRDRQSGDSGFYLVALRAGGRVVSMPMTRVR